MTSERFPSAQRNGRAQLLAHLLSPLALRERDVKGQGDVEAGGNVKGGGDLEGGEKN